MDRCGYLNDVPYWPSTEKRYSNIYKYDDVNKISSMSQSRVISVLLRASQLSGDTTFSDLADEAIKAYFIDYEEGAFFIRDRKRLCFEENGRPGILNHHIFSMFGLFDYCRVYPEKREAKSLLRYSIQNLKDNMINYDSGWWSFYDNYVHESQRRFNPATRHYHWIHISQLEALYRLTNDDFFREQALKFSKYDSLINRVKMYFLKAKVTREMGRL